MISVLTLTYRRPHLLEEAIKSFLQSMTYAFKHQDGLFQTEMVIINDNPEVDYVYDQNPHVRIINHKERFPSIASKLQWGFTQCKYDYIYRLDDDDLLSQWGINNATSDINNYPGFDIYRSYGMYMFSENKYEGIHSNVNNGNVYSKSYLERIKFPDTSIGEDADITFHKGGVIYESKLLPTMCYRWGMQELHPKFLNDYYGQINRIS
jgi:hypothetical protein